MTLEPVTGNLLIVFDAQARDFISHCRRQACQGEQIARKDIDGLWALAGSVATSLEHWGALLDDLELARGPPLGLARAGRLLVEGLFDEILSAPAIGVFCAALDLALQRP